jgi:DNA repair protein RecO (recombination protein O)
MSLVTVPGVLLRSHPYSESSLILRFLTPEFGVVSVLARGVRRRSSRGEAPMETFQRGLLTFHHREDRDLHGFREFHAHSSPRALASDLLRFSGASFLAELVLTHALQGPSADLHGQVVELLERLESGPVEGLPTTILGGAWTLLVEFGFPPSVERCLGCGGVLPGEGLGRFDLEGGGIRCSTCADRATGPRMGPEAQAALGQLLSGELPLRLRGSVAHLALVERYALHHLGGRRPFQTTPLLRDALGRLEGEAFDGADGDAGGGA